VTMVRPRVLEARPADLQLAAEVLQAGGLVAFPTETVYGLGAHARDAAAVARLFRVKGRPADNPVIVHLAGLDALGQVAAQVTPLARSLAAQFWPGPLTLVLPARGDVPAVVTGAAPTVGVRVPDHPVALGLLAAADLPVAAPSANRSGRPSPTTAAHVTAEFGADVEVVVDGGACRLGLESTVVDARGRVPVVLREGTVTREDLGLGLRGVPAGRSSAAPGAGTSTAASPGTRYRHYAPRCPVELVAPGQGGIRAAIRARAGEHVGLVAAAPADAVEAVAVGGRVTVLATFHDAVELGRRLYDALRRGEQAGVDVIVVESVPEAGVGRAVMDRLRRAAGQLG